jgi:hypothetical protein
MNHTEFAGARITRLPVHGNCSRIRLSESAVYFESLETNSMNWLLNLDRIENTPTDALLSVIGMLERANMLDQRSGLWNGDDGGDSNHFSHPDSKTSRILMAGNIESRKYASKAMGNNISRSQDDADMLEENLTACWVSSMT